MLLRKEAPAVEHSFPLPDSPANSEGRKALIIVDVQNDFCENGALAVEGGNEVARRISKAESLRDCFDFLIATQDWHIEPGDHFSSTPDFLSSWPVHCRAGEKGAQLKSQLSAIPLDALFRKGEYSAAYSGFEGLLASNQRDSHPQMTLENWLTSHSVKAVSVCGLAFDYCVRATALDAQNLGFCTSVLTSLTAGIAEESVEKTREELQSAGVLLL